MNLNQLFANKRIVFLIAGLVVIVLILFIIRVVTYTPPIEVSPSSPPLSSTPIPRPSIVVPANPVVYTPSNLEKDFDRINNPKALPQADVQVKQKLLLPLKGLSGVIKTSPTFQLEYVKGPDSFMAEVRNVNTEQAKKDVTDYLTSAGLSQTGICNLPVVFYLSSTVQKALIDTGKTFNPIPEGC